jgi:DNA invertase Pin-like site-specific DNA recombinase
MLFLKGLKPDETNPTLALYGYARVSSSDQDFAQQEQEQEQEQALRAAGCDVVRAEKVSGTSVPDAR